MFPPGHVGIALALYAPVGLVLLLRGRARLAVAGTAAIACLTLLPDVDKWLPWFVHRGRTHTVWFALGTGVWLGGVASFVGGYRDRDRATVLGSAAFGFVVGTLAVLAHLVGDVITPMGVRPFYPLSGFSYTLSLVFASDAAANARLFALGCLAAVAMVLLGVGLPPVASRRSTVREALRDFVRDVRYGTGGEREGTPGRREASNAASGTGPIRSESDD